MRTTGWTILIALVLAASAAADVIHYKDGRKLEGEILEQTADELTVKTSFGTITVAMSKIARIEKKLTPAQELAARRAEVPDDDAPALFQLAMWASEHKLRKEHRDLIGQVIAADPGHRRANELLGRVDVEGVWMDSAEVEAYLERVADEKHAQGLLLHEGQWLPEAEVMEARGLMLHDGEWIPRREAETRQALEALVEIFEIETQATAGEFLTVFSATVDEDTVESLIYDLDAEVRDFLRRLQLDEIEVARVTRFDIPIFLAPGQVAADRMLESGFTRRYVHGDATVEAFLGRTSFGLHWPRPLIVLVEGRNLDATGDRERMRSGLLSHQVANLLVERLKGERDPPGWARAGLAAFYEGATNYYSTVTLTSDRVDDAGDPIRLWIGGWETYPDWRDNLGEEDLQATVGPLKQLFRRPLEELDSRDVGVSWSLVSFLFERHATEFTEFLRVYDSEPLGADRTIRRMHERAWERAFAITEDELDREWRLWALARPKRFPSDELGR